jgi:hypothetical protein
MHDFFKADCKSWHLFGTVVINHQILSYDC